MELEERDKLKVALAARFQMPPEVLESVSPELLAFLQWQRRMLVDKLVLCRQPEELVRAQAKVEVLQVECEMVKEILNKMEEMQNGRED